tara:strand:- start:1443 stop:1829 length:387 start_codon:yes stop_codon:yes gene_type:complete
MSSELSEILASINNTKEHLYVDDPDRVKSYPPYIINRCLSGHLDAILFANEMNRHPDLDKRLQYDFLLNTLSKRKRFTPWLKKEQIEYLDLVKEHYGYSNEKARVALTLLTNTQLEYIRQRHEKGGRQ